MPRFIVHHNGAFGIFSTVPDAMVHGPWTEAQLIAHLEQHTTIADERTCPIAERIARAKQKGTSSLDHDSLADTVRFNRNGPNERRMKVEDLIAEYLTFPDAAARKGGGA